jgi:DNA polymerase V
MHIAPAVIGPPIFLGLYLKAVRAGFPSPADDYLDAPIDLSQTLIQNAPATFIMTVAGDSAIDVGIFDGSLITVDRSLVPRDGDAVVVDVNGERSIKIVRIAGGRSSLAFGNRRYPEYEPGPDAEIAIFGVVTNTVRRFRR